MATGQETSRRAPLRAAAKRVLVVDDDREFREAQLRDLELAGIPVVVVTAFEESLDGTELLRKPFLVEDFLDAVQRLAA